jgi:prevent-host-death family protein
MDEKTISLRDANQRFAELVRRVESGERFVVTRRGQPVARIEPVAGKRKLTPAQERAWKRLKRRMEKGYDLGGLKIDRDELYDDA